MANPTVAPATGAFLVTPADSDLSKNARSLYIGVTGNVRVTTIAGDDVLFTNVPVGFFPVAVKRVWATNTTASGIVGLR